VHCSIVFKATRCFDSSCETRPAWCCPGMICMPRTQDHNHEVRLRLVPQHHRLRIPMGVSREVRTRMGVRNHLRLMNPCLHPHRSVRRHLQLPPRNLSPNPIPTSTMISSFLPWTISIPLTPYPRWSPCCSPYWMSSGYWSVPLISISIVSSVS